MQNLKNNFRVKVRLGFIFVNGGRFGGPEKRMIRMANWLSKNSDYDLYVYIGTRLFDWLNLNESMFNKNINLHLYDDKVIENKKNGKNHSNGNKKIVISIKKIIPKKIKIIKNIIINSYALHKWVKNNKIEILHGWHAAGELMVPLKMFNKVKLIYSITSSYGSVGVPAKWIGNLSYKSIFKFSDIIEFLSEDIKFKYDKIGLKVSNKRLFIAPCSFIEIDDMFVGPKEKIIVSGAARYEKEKNIPLLIEVANFLINEKGMKINFEILGPKRGSGDIIEKIHKYNLEEYIRLHYKNKPADSLSKSLIFLSLQDFNNYPSQLLMEAMACGCAIIATNVGETYKLVDDKVGYLIDKNIKEISDKIISLLENEERTMKLGMKARRRIESKHNIQNYMNYITEIYDTVKSNKIDLAN